MWQVETAPVPHYVIDIRTNEEQQEQELPTELKNAIRIPGALQAEDPLVAS